MLLDEKLLISDILIIKLLFGAWPYFQVFFQISLQNFVNDGNSLSNNSKSQFLVLLLLTSLPMTSQCKNQREAMGGKAS